MSTTPIPSVAPIALQPGEGEARWFLGFLITIKSSAETTGGRVAVIEHLGAQGPGSPLHVMLPSLPPFAMKTIPSDQPPSATASRAVAAADQASVKPTRSGVQPGAGADSGGPGSSWNGRAVITPSGCSGVSSRSGISWAAGNRSATPSASMVRRLATSRTIP